MFICLCLCIFYAAYVQIGANWCKCMLRCTSIATYNIATIRQNVTRALSKYINDHLKSLI